MTGSPAMSSHLTVVLESNSHVAKLRRALYCIYQSIRRVEDKATMKMREGGGGGGVRFLFVEAKSVLHVQVQSLSLLHYPGFCCRSC